MMVTAGAIPHFWTAVEDCLVTFHNLPRCVAAEKVTSLLRRLPVASNDSPSALSDLIYHAEPWWIACDLADHELPIAEHQQKYERLLMENGLTSR